METVRSNSRLFLHMRLYRFPLVLAAATVACTAPPAAREVATATYTNPVLDADFPDPTVVGASDGHYYAYATQTERGGETLNIQVARSDDLVHWETLGDALPVKPAWADSTQDFWAPHVSEHGGVFYLYYSAKPDAALADTTRGLCLGVATARAARGPFADSGQPLRCGPGFVNIDPMQFDDPATGKPLLYWGSGLEPIRVQELAPDRTSFAPGSAPRDVVTPVETTDRTIYQRLVEGAWVTYEAPWYYLFYSGDNCCGVDAHYAVMVARSRSATGPFETLAAATGRAQSVILERGGRWSAPGHNSIVRDASGQSWIVYHAIDEGAPSVESERRQADTRRVMLIDRLRYENGWPAVDGGHPSASPRPAPRAR